MFTLEDNDIMFMSGDVFETYFHLDGIDEEVIANVYFSVGEENIVLICPYISQRQGYYLRFTSEESAALIPKICSYDLTVEFIDGRRLTVLHEQPFIVRKKRNILEVTVDEDEEGGENEDENGGEDIGNGDDGDNNETPKDDNGEGDNSNSGENGGDNPPVSPNPNDGKGEDITGGDGDGEGENGDSNEDNE